MSAIEVPHLPPRSFAEFAIEASLHASSEARFAGQLEIMVASRPDQPAFAATLRRANESAKAAAEAHAAWKHLMVYEREIRELVARLDAEKRAAADAAHNRVIRLDRVISAARRGETTLFNDPMEAASA